jgi:hypothetical protein
VQWAYPQQIHVHACAVSAFRTSGVTAALQRASSASRTGLLRLDYAIYWTVTPIPHDSFLTTTEEVG